MDLKCQNCGAELVPGTNFCRQCGAASSAARAGLGSEDPTTLLNASEGVATERLDSRPTGDRGPGDLPPTPNRTTRTLIVGGISLLLVLGVLCAILFSTLKHRNQATANASLIYPGAKTLVDMNYDDGARAIQLETDDPLSKVESWYQSSLKPSKVMRLNAESVILKGGNATATIAAADNKTSIVIKLTP